MKKEINPPDYFLSMAILEIGFFFLAPVLVLITIPFNYLGLLFIIFGVILNMWADGLFKKNKTTVKPKEIPEFLITTGPFRISRHPMYLGMFLILIGEAIFLGVLTAFILPLAFLIIINSIFIPNEEKNLRKAFGKKYDTYSKNTRKFI